MVSFRARLCLVVIVLLCAVQGVAQRGELAVTTLADITGDSAAHQLQTSGSARWVQIVCANTNTSVVRVGDINTSSTRGVTLLPGGGVMLPPMPNAPTYQAVSQYYDLSKIYYYVATGDKISVMWGK